ncbi:MAG: dihydrodipicolinate reductase [Nitrososphaerota archaeon]|nr:dihydrodipicolinate reductase [Nitrososphaerota archaeon]MDG6922577.1 dihydrodipicolinate reductase [Nitrososphaerota archaeon]
MDKWKVVSVGLGSVGSAIAKVALGRNSQLEFIGAVDPDPRITGKDLGTVIGLERTLGIRVQKDGRDVYRHADIVLHATTSLLSKASPQLLEFCKAGVDVVSTCEELSYPWFTHKEIAKELDFEAKKNGITLLGTGVNPGFVLDALAVTLSGVCQGVSEIHASRILDATKRRLPFQMKIGIGLTPAEFEERVKSGTFGHIGLPESLALTCASLGKEVEKIDQRIYPKIAQSPVETEYFGTIESGKVIGLVQDGAALAGGKRVASYHIEMYAGALEAYDEIEIAGTPNISLRIINGTPGDIATAAIIVNSIPRVIDSPAGLKTVKDLRPASSLLV